MDWIFIVLVVVLLLVVASIFNYDYFMGHPITLSKPGYKVKTTPFSCSHDGITLHGEILMPNPQPKEKMPTVIICHGLGSSYKLSKLLAGTTLAQSGYCCVVFDFYGGNKQSISGGTMLDMSIFTEKADLHCVTDYVKTLSFVDLEHLYLMGESQGGCVAGITANERDDYKALMLYYPAFCIPDDAQKKFKSPDDVPETVKFGANTMGKKYYTDVLGWDVYAHLAGYKKDVLIVHGDADRVVPVECGYKAKEIYDKAELVILPKQDHGFNGKGKADAVRAVYKFLEKEK